MRALISVVVLLLFHNNRSVFLHRWQAELARRPSFATGSDEEVDRLWASRAAE